MRKFTFLIMFIAICISPASAAPKKKEICPSPVTIACLRKNFEALYQDNVNVCTSAYRKHQDKALSCNDLKATAGYLSLALVVEDNAEISEDFGEVLENFIIDKPACFLDAASQLDALSLRALIKNYAKNPPFVDEKKIKKTMQKHRNNPKYSKIMSLYFGR